MIGIIKNPGKNICIICHQKIPNDEIFQRELYDGIIEKAHENCIKSENI